ncbi:MAG: NAD(P)-binding domain-containing protein [Planctomycetota bacterium]|nr:NAD(P)-binding domain-containing protein [Planctomycetota bacterium]
MEHYQVGIIGAGPIGLEMAVALQRASVRTVQIEAGAIGSTMGWWAPGTKYFSSPERIAIAGVPLVVEHEDKATREDYLRYLRQVVMQFGLDVRTYERVVGATRDDDGFVLRTEKSAHGVGGVEEQQRAARMHADVDGRDGVGPRSVPPRGMEYRVEKIVLAIGNMHTPRLVGVPGEELPHVSHYLGEPHRYFGQRVVIVGGRNSAIEAAIRLYRVGAKVTLCQRRLELERDRIKYWLLPEVEWLIKKGQIGLHAGVGVREITERGVVIEPLAGGATGAAGGPRAKARSSERVEIGADAVLLLTGYDQNPELFEMLGVELHSEEHRPRFARETMETNVPGVFVAGTATGGSQQRSKIFIENSHEHVERIARAIAGRDVEVRERAVFEGNEES